MQSKSDAYVRKGAFFTILLSISILFFGPYILGCAKQQNKALITVADEERLSIRFDNEESCIDTLTFGHRLYQVSNYGESAQVQFRVIEFSDDEINTLFASDSLSVKESGNYFNVSISDGSVCVSQFGEAISPKIVATYDLEKIPVKPYKTSSFSWLNHEAELEKEIVCFQFYGSMTNELSTIDANFLEPSELIDTAASGFCITIALTETDES